MRRRITVRLAIAVGLLSLAAGGALAGGSLHSAAARTPAVTFGRAATVAVGDEGFEPGLSINSHDQMFSSVPNGFASTISFIWRSFDHGQSWHLVPASSPAGTGKPITCVGGGDSETAIDNHDRLYFADLQGLTNFSTSRSDDNGASFQTSCAGVISTGVDRQWYAIDGDPLNGGHVFLTFDDVAQGDPLDKDNRDARPHAALRPRKNQQTQCAGNNELVITQSPPRVSQLPASQTAGLQFGPDNMITCNEGIMGPDGVSPHKDPTYHKHYVFVAHDSSALDQVRIARCVQVPVTVDPSGLQCTDKFVYGPTGKYIVGQNFVAMAIDRSGNIYLVWAQAPGTQSGGPTGPSTIMMSYSKDNGNTWSSPVAVSKTCSGFHCSGVQTNTNVMPWVVAGDNGRIDVAWYGTQTLTTTDKPTGTYGADNLTNADWKVYFAQSLNADSSQPSFNVLAATKKYIHDGSVYVLPTQAGDRTLGDFLKIQVGPKGQASIVYVDAANDTDLGQTFFVRQNGGPSLFSKVGQVPHFAAPTNSVSDASCTSTNDDAVYNANGTSTSFCKTNLDILHSSVRVDPKNSHMLQIGMKVADLTSLAPPSNSGGTVVDWLTAWHQDCTHKAACPNNGHLWFTYMESNNGAAPVFYSGSSNSLCCAFTTYPGQNQIAAATSTGVCDKTHSVDCYTPGKPGRIVIDVPLSKVSTPLRNHWLYSVTASTFTLPQPANSNTSTCGQTTGCGIPPNVIDSTPPYDANINGAVR